MTVQETRQNPRNDVGKGVASTMSRRQPPELGALWARLAAASPGSFLMRGTADAPGAWSARGTDLDILADDATSLESAEALLVSLGFAREWASEAYRRRYCLRRLGSHLANVDLYEAALWGPGFAYHRPARDLSVAEACLLRAVFDKHDLSYFHERSTRDELPSSLARSVPATREPGRRAAALLAAELLMKKSVRPVPSAIYGTLSRRLNRVLGGNPGLEVAVVGPDGSGKTTLVRHLNEACPLPIEVLYMGGRDFKTLLMRKTVGKRGSSIPRHIEQMSRRIRGWMASRRGKVVLYERHPHETEPGPNGHPLMRPFTRGLFRLYDFPVDVAFVLTGDPEIMFARKGEHDPARLRSMDERLRGISERHSREFQVFDSTSTSADELAESIAQLLVERYQALNRG